jgi:glutamyl/glutaminyl-tRNA synthetase
VAKHLSDPAVLAELPAWREELMSIAPFDAATLEQALRRRAESAGIKAGVLIHATRVAVVGVTTSPGLFEVLELIGRDAVTARIDDVMAGRV